QAGLDRKEAEAALADEALRRAVAEEEEKARAMGVNGVPFFIFNNRLAVEGAQPPEVLLDAMLEAEKESAAARRMDRAPSTVSPVSFHPRPGDSALAARLRREIEGEVLFDPASRGRYSTDASIYQIDPVGVVVPKTEQDAKIALRIAVEEGVPILARGAGSSQCGQTVGAALVIDHSKFLNRIVSFDKDAATAVVQPGVVLDGLNAHLRRHGLWFPVD